MDELGLRERKKQRTKQALVTAALNLFRVQGYDQTTIDQIAAAADVSRATFFSYFPTKEDVLFTGTDARTAAVLEVIADAPPEEGVVDILVRAARGLADPEWGVDSDGELAQVVGRLLTTVPALQAQTLYRLSLAEARIADALQRSRPDELDAITASALVGAVVRAGTAAVMAVAQAGGTVEDARAAVRETTELVAQGLRHSFRPAVHRQVH